MGQPPQGDVKVKRGEEMSRRTRMDQKHPRKTVGRKRSRGNAEAGRRDHRGTNTCKQWPNSIVQTIALLLLVPEYPTERIGEGKQEKGDRRAYECSALRNLL